MTIVDLFLDTATTGLGYSDVVIDIAICTASGEVLFNEKLKPHSPTGDFPDWAGAERFHKISEEEVANCKTFEEYIDELKKILVGNKIHIFNSDFDIRMLTQTAQSHGLDCDWIQQLDSVCIMSLMGVTWHQYSNYYGGISLEMAVHVTIGEFVGVRGTALGNVLSAAAAYAECLRLIASDEKAPFKPFYERGK